MMCMKGMTMKKLIATAVLLVCSLAMISIPALAASTAANQTYVVTGTYVNVRSGPGVAFEKLGKLEKGTKETGVVTNGWLKFTYDGADAYCSASYLSVYTVAAAEPTPADEVSAVVKTDTMALAQTYVVTATELRIRSGPGTTYTVVGSLPSGTQETGIITDGWLKFTYNNETVYCSASYLVQLKV